MNLFVVFSPLTPAISGFSVFRRPMKKAPFPSEDKHPDASEVDKAFRDWSEAVPNEDIRHRESCHPEEFENAGVIFGARMT